MFSLPCFLALRLIIVLLSFGRSTHARFSYETCCNDANNARSLFTQDNFTQIFAPLLDDYTTCNQEYNATIPPATDVYVRYSHCRTNCSGFDLSVGTKPDAWAGPVVQFILPSLIFSMSIPRRTVFMPLEVKKAWWSPFSGCFLLVLTAIDTLAWVAIILAMAGPLMVAGLTEAWLDYRIMKALSSSEHSALNNHCKLRVILTVVCGNLQLRQVDASQDDNFGDRTPLHPSSDTPGRPDPLHEIPAALEKFDFVSVMKSRLLNLMSAQGDFGALVGAPVAFYLGGFVYTILDLLQDPSVQDAAISLAFGVEWMIVVHVAIVSGCLLASNNPSTVSVLGHLGVPSYVATSWPRSWFPLAFQTRYQPVSMLNRGNNKRKWLQSIPAYKKGPEVGTRITSNVGLGSTTEEIYALQDFAAHLQSDIRQQEALDRLRKEVLRKRPFRWDYWLQIIIPSIILIGIPSAAGGFVAYLTPPSGWGCRSLTLVCYAGCQVALTLWHELKQRVQPERPLLAWKRPLDGPWWRCTKRNRSVTWYDVTILPIYWLLCLGALFTALGGTMMQIMGVYKNCLCYVNAGMWLSLEEAFVEVASDTLGQRSSSENWIKMGSAASVFMAVNAYGGWWYQKMIRTEYKRQVERLAESH